LLHFRAMWTVPTRESEVRSRGSYIVVASDWKLEMQNILEELSLRVWWSSKKRRMKEIGGIGEREMLIRMKERKGTLSGQENVLLSLSLSAP
jgi:hypothetical protein